MGKGAREEIEGRVGCGGECAAETVDGWRAGAAGR